MLHIVQLGEALLVGGHASSHVLDDLRGLLHAEVDLVQIVHDPLQLLRLAV